MMEYWWWLQGRRFQLWQCVRYQAEKIEIASPTHFKFVSFCFLIFLDFFAMFYVDIVHNSL